MQGLGFKVIGCRAFFVEPREKNPCRISEENPFQTEDLKAPRHRTRSAVGDFEIRISTGYRYNLSW